jgi:hypothetical protein
MIYKIMQYPSGIIDRVVATSKEDAIIEFLKKHPDWESVDKLKVKREKKMKNYSIHDIKRMAKEYGFKFYQGKGYCYFSPVEDLDVMLNFDSVSVCYWHQADLTFWEKELQYKIQNEMDEHFHEIYKNSKYWEHAYKRAQEI